MEPKLIKLVISLVLILLSIHCNEAARILAFFPSPTKSHFLIHAAVAKTLAEDGHEVTVLATTPNAYKQAKYKFIHIDNPDMYDEEFHKSLVEEQEPTYKRFHKLMENIVHHTNTTLAHPTLREFLRTHKAGDFDVMLYGYFMNDAGLAVAAHFRCPVIISFMIQTIYPLNRILGNPSEFSYVPTLFSGFQQPMSFPQRVLNFLATMLEQNVWSPWLYRQLKEVYSYNFPADRYPPLEEVYKNVSMVFTNHHFSQGPIRPNVPALIEIGGIQIKEQPDPLPQDLASILDAATEGVIYFSFGSSIQGSHISQEKAKIIFKVLSKLPQKVLMKWSDADKTDVVGENIIIRQWLPQDDVLAHPNVKLFITHGGQGSVVESQYHGVPMVGIPFFGDQHSNMANVENSGFGLSLEYTALTEENFENVLLKVLNNPKYRENVQTFSKLYRDRPMSPRQLVRYWVDYVVRHNGAQHMQSPAAHMSWWEIYSLDVIGLLLVVVLAVVGLLVGLCRLLCCRRKTGSSRAVNKEKKNN